MIFYVKYVFDFVIVFELLYIFVISVNSSRLFLLYFEMYARVLRGYAFFWGGGCSYLNDIFFC